MNYTVTLEKIEDLKINSSELSKQLENQKFVIICLQLVIKNNISTSLT